MSETLFKFLFSEISAIRITCQRKLTGGEVCGGTMELAVGKLHTITKCPFCGNAFEDARTPFSGLDAVFKHMVTLEADTARVEIVIPSK
jgi:hypothetical protein